eukprot:Clim_evm12s25 gene=Clim_evmTU12s25
MSIRGPSAQFPAMVATAVNRAKDKEYVIDVQVLPLPGSGNDEAVAVGYANGRIEVLTPQGSASEMLTQQISLKHHNTRIVRVQSPEAGAGRLLWSCSSDGSALLTDLRTPQKPSVVLPHEFPAVQSFAVDVHNQFAAVGSDKIGQDAHVAVYDLRGPARKVGHFSDAHSDDVTALCFHAQSPSSEAVLLSGSTDTMFNVFHWQTGQIGSGSATDSFVMDEDEFLRYTCTTSSIAKLGTFGPGGKYAYALCHDEAFTVYDLQTGDELVHFADVRVPLQAPAVDGLWDQLIDGIYIEDTTRFYLASSTSNGTFSLLHVNKGSVQKGAEITQPHTELIRTLHNRGRVLYTGGEDGAVVRWQL